MKSEGQTPNGLTGDRRTNVHGPSRKLGLQLRPLRQAHRTPWVEARDHTNVLQVLPNLPSSHQSLCITNRNVVLTKLQALWRVLR